MTADPKSLWVYLAANPLLHLTLTLLAYQFGDWIYRKANRNPLLNPVMISVAVLVSILLVTGTDYATYFEGAQFVHFLLGPATVALAIPLFKQFHMVRRSAVAIMAAILAGFTSSSRPSPIMTAPLISFNHRPSRSSSL